MKYFSKKETPVQNIAFISISVALLLVLIAISRFIPFCFIILALIVPLLSALTSVFVKPKYYLLYLLASILLALSITFDMFNDTIFYVIPGLFIGGLIGLGIKRKYNVVYLIFLASVLKMGLEMSSIPLIKLIYEVDMFSTFTKILSLSNYQYTYLFFPLILMLFGMTESLISISIISIPLNSFKEELNVSTTYNKTNNYISFFSVFLCIIFIFAHPMFQSLSFIFAAVSTYFCATLVFTLDYKKKMTIIIIATSFIVSIIIFVITFNFTRSPFAIMSFLLPIITTDIYALFLYKIK